VRSPPWPIGETAPAAGGSVVVTILRAGPITVAAVRLPILAALSANTISKLVAAFAGGGLAYGSEVGLGLLFTLAGAWIPLLFAG